MVDLHPEDGWRRPVPGKWAEQAACADKPGDWWFPDAIGAVGRPRKNQTSGLPPDARAAIAVCNTCPVQPECLEHAVRVGEDDGIWGGRLPDERKKLRRSMKSTVA